MEAKWPVVRVCVLRTDGTNCDVETAYAFTLAGAHAEYVHVNELASSSRKLEEFQILALPGGFSYGDDVRSGKILAVELESRLRDQIQQFVSSGKLVIGICNGFQVLVQMGLLPFGTVGHQQVTLTDNDSKRFECRWVRMETVASPCVFTRELPERIELPVAHGEGKVFAPSETIAKIEAAGLVPLRYEDGQNPNGSMNAIAGLTDPTGRILGLMPHPERFINKQQHPNWRRGESNREIPDGLWFFRNAVSAVR
jgi:phosphoribosylformylglycinamidine synthase